MKALIAFIFLVTAACITFVAIDGRNRADRRQQALEAKQADAREMESFRKQGYEQCAAGDMDGCTYFINKLRDKGAYTDSEFLKCNLIVAQWLTTSPLIYDLREKFRNGTATEKDFQSMAATMGAMGNPNGEAALVLYYDRPAWAPKLPDRNNARN